MRIYLLRHADAEPEKPESECERELTPRGHEQTGRLMRWAKRHKLRFGIVATSPRLRAVQTAQPLASTVQAELVKEPRLAGGELNVSVLNELVAELGSPQSLLVVGHEPDLSNAVEELTGGVVHFATATLALVECAQIMPGEAELLWLLPAALLD